MMTHKEAILSVIQEGTCDRHLVIERAAERAGTTAGSLARTVRKLVSDGVIEGVLPDSGAEVQYRISGVSVIDRQPDDPDILRLERQLQARADETRSLRQKLRALQRHESGVERILEHISACVDAFEPVIPPPMVLDVGDRTHETTVLMMGDLHIDEFVDPEDTAGLAEYNVEIATLRAQRLAEAVVDVSTYKLSGYCLPKLVIFLLGDIVSTNIHGVMDNVGASPVDSLFHSAYLLAQFFLDMVRHFQDVHVVCVPGNHGRLTEDVRFKQPYSNFDYILYQLLGVMLKDQPNISFDIPRSFMCVTEVEGWSWLLVHGSIARSWHGIPWYGIVRALKNIRELLETTRSTQKRKKLLDEEERLMEEMERERERMWRVDGIRFDYCAMGHFHTSGTLDIGTGEVFMNGSMIGPTDFSIQRMQAGNAPRHWFIGMNRKHGATWRYNFDLDRVSDDMQVRYKVGGTGVLVDELRELERGLDDDG